MNPTVQQPQATIPALLPGDVVCDPSGNPAVVVVRTARGWTVLSADQSTGWLDAAVAGHPVGPGLSLVEAMSLADLVATELGAAPEPDREARRAARSGGAGGEAPAQDPRDEEIAGLRRTVGQLEHALAARVSIERAIGVLAERHGIAPREAFEELRRCARSEGRPAQELAAEVLDGLPVLPAVPARRTTPGHTVPGRTVPGHTVSGHTVPGHTVPGHTAPGPTAPGPGMPSAPEPRPAGGSASARRVQRGQRRSGGGDTVPGAPR